MCMLVVVEMSGWSTHQVSQCTDIKHLLKVGERSTLNSHVGLIILMSGIARLYSRVDSKQIITCNDEHVKTSPGIEIPLYIFLLFVNNSLMAFSSIVIPL